MQVKSLKLKAPIAIAALILATFGVVSAQTQPPAPPMTEKPVKIGKFKTRPAPKVWAINTGGGTYEKSIMVDPRVSVSLCVTEGNVKVNGWSRNEVRVFVKDGSKVGFNILQKSRQGDSPVWIKVVGFDPAKPTVPKECLWGNEVEIDVPTGAAINLKGEATQTVVDSVRKIVVNNTGGGISIRNITEGVDATTYQGDVDVENSDGMITLETTDGNILVFESEPSQVGDIFKARSSSGKISLQNLKHRQVDVNSTSGSVLFNGSLLPGGIYGFKTIKGSVTLGIQPDPPCFISATYGYGNFNSELPIKISTEDVSPGQIKSIKGTLGKGDCKLNLTTTSGSIRLMKQQAGSSKIL